MPLFRSHRYLPAVLALLLTGCLPYSCSRTESRTLLPSDSLARAMSAALPVDTLVTAGTLSFEGLEYPRTVLYDDAGTLWVADTRTNSVFWSAADGVTGKVELDSLRYPYLAGLRNGRPVVFSPDAAVITLLDSPVAGESGSEEARLVARASSAPASIAATASWRASTPPGLPPRALQYAVVGDSAAWLKVAGADLGGFLVEFDNAGVEIARTPLTDPYWRWAGALRFWNGRLISLSGYRPQLYFWEDGRLDSLQLSGFDSPMLPRSRGFMLGMTGQPPLLTPSATPIGEDLLVVNVRPGWLRLEIYDSEGALRRILVEPDPAFAKEFFPTDVAAMQVPGGRTVVAVSVTEPRAEIRLYEIPR